MIKMTKKELIKALQKCKGDGKDSDVKIVISDDGVSEKYVTAVKEVSNKIKLIVRW